MVKGQQTLNARPGDTPYLQLMYVSTKVAKQQTVSLQKKKSSHPSVVKMHVVHMGDLEL